MTTVLTYGTYDMFHFGHVRLLRRLKDMGDTLIVGCSTDEFNRQKGKKSYFSFDARCEMLMSCKYVDMIIPEISWEQKRYDIIKHRVDIFSMGDDWLGRFDDLKDLCKVVYLPRTEGVSSSMIKASLFRSGACHEADAKIA